MLGAINDTIKRSNQLLGLMSAAVDTSVEAIRHSRLYPNTYIRGIVIERLVREGFSKSDIGRAIGIDHATVLYWHRRITELEGCGFVGAPDVKSAYKAFLSALGENTPESISLPEDARAVLGICLSTLKDRFDQGNLSVNEYTTTTQTIKTKTQNYYYGCKNLEASR